MNGLVSILAALLLATTVLGQHCVNPKFTDVKTHVTQDFKLNTETAFTVEFKLECVRGTKSVPLYAEVNGQFIPSSCDVTGTKYQFSWTDDHKSAQTGEISLKVYDEEGYLNVKKAQRNNADASSIAVLKTITFQHQAAYRGPYLNSEIVSVVIFGLIFYYAQSARACIQA